MKDYTDEDLYEILHVKKNATQEDIKLAYHRLVRLFHPDINENSESDSIFRKIRYAYGILSDINKRRIYDIKIDLKNSKDSSDIDSNDNKNEENLFNQKENCPKNKSVSKRLNEIFEGIFINIKNSTKSTRANNKLKKKNGDDIYANVTISSKEAVLGTTRIINVVQSRSCPNCEGKKFINEALCPLCKGHGEISTHKKINAVIPPNTKNGDKIKIEKSGNQGINGGQTGDLYLIVSIDEKSLFTVKDDVVYMDLPITPFEAVLGANIDIPTFYENVTIKIPPNTPSGQKFRLKGQGIYLKDKGSNGDMIVTVVIKIPQKLSDKEIEIYKTLRENSTCNVREGLNNNE